MKTYRNTPSGYAFVAISIVFALIASACAPTAQEVAVELATLQAAPASGPAATSGCPAYNENGWPLTEETASGTCIYTSYETATPSVSVAPTTAPSGNCDYANLIVPAVAWTDWLPADNKVCENAIKIRPEPFETTVPLTTDRAVQAASDMDDTNPAGTLRKNPQYEYDLPPGVRPVYQASQSDAAVSLQLCWQREERDGNTGTLETQLLVKMRPHNGGSALITLIPVATSDVPPIGTRCPSGE